MVATSELGSPISQHRTAQAEKVQEHLQARSVVVDTLYVIFRRRLTVRNRPGLHHSCKRRAALVRRSVIAAVRIWLAVQFGGPAAQGAPSGARLGSGLVTVACPVTKKDPPRTAPSTSSPLVVTETSEQLEVTVPPLVFVTVEPGVLRVSTNTGLPPATTDGFYLIRSGRAGHAPASVVETVLHSCR